MTDHATQILGAVGSAPPELLAWYQAPLPDYPESRIHCLPFEAALATTRALQDISVAQQLGLWVLDDANDSNPYALITRGPCTGAVIHFSHDPEPSIAYATLESFTAALTKAGEEGTDIDDLTPAPPTLPLDPELQALAQDPEEEEEDAVFLITTYLPVAAPLEQTTTTLLATHEDFFVREALANHLAQHPRPTTLHLAQTLATDPHPQVATAGKTALSHHHRTGHR